MRSKIDQKLKLEGGCRGVTSQQTCGLEGGVTRGQQRVISKNSPATARLAKGLPGQSLLSIDNKRELNTLLLSKIEREIETITHFSVPFPVSVNAVWMPLYGRMVLRPEARQYRDKLLAAFKRDGLPVKFDKADRLAVHYVLFEPDASRDRDVANYEKLLTDVLQKAGIIPNDYQIDDNRQTRGGVDAERPRVEVYIEKIAI